MNLRSFDLNLLLIFDAIYSEGSISKAALNLHLSQPTVSNALARLRVRLEDPLFERSRKGMIPTSRAKQLAEPIRDALETLERGLSGNEAFDFSRADREFVIAVEDYGESVVLPRFMQWLSGVAPNLRIRISPELGLKQLKTELREGVVDLALDYFPLPQPDYKCPCVLTESLITLSRNGHPDLGKPMSLDSYLTLPHIVLSGKSNSHPMIDMALSKRGLRRKIALRVPHFMSMPLVVQSTNMLCTLPERMGRLYATNFNLKLHKVPVGTPRFPIYLAWHKSLDHDAGHQWFRARLIESCRAL